MMDQSFQQFPEVMFNPWMVPVKSEADGQVSMVFVQGAFPFYFDLVASNQLPARTLLADLHYLTGGSQDAFDWLCGEIPQAEVERDELLERYRAFDESNTDCVGPLFLHYYVACANGWEGTYEVFRARNCIGDELLKPVLMVEVEETTA